MLPDQRIVMSVRPELCQACLGIDSQNDDSMNGMNGRHDVNGHGSETETEAETETSGNEPYGY
ncbi:hypothetical protein SCP_0900480 [Sparassis crispa]|uniref:Uncharacterized protein n=1 Tax=Sparassis crispa TaxID=139825 RepID=A0A401GVB0_9APHY|nr:hypothetical protein SCP_0900480 [Sparassis crispa]GBE86171.1 hypothetical protein SCP_0900480 [Sparassis crispa]